MPVTPTELVVRRIDEVRRLLSESADALLIFDPVQRGYLTGFVTGVNVSPGRALLVPGEGSPRLFVGGTDLEESQLELVPAGIELELYDIDRKETTITRMVELAPKLKVSRLAVEQASTSVHDWLELKRLLTGVEVVPVSIVNRVREVKDRWETQQIRAACDAGRTAFQRLLPRLKPGLSEWEIAVDLEHELRLAGRGSTRLAFQSVVVSGPRSSLPHGMVTDRRLAQGDFLTLDFGATWNGYCCDITRTVVIGQASDRQREVYNAVTAAQQASIEAMGPGLARTDAETAGRAVIASADLEQYLAHGTGGHGIGLEVHEGPSTRSEGTWEPGNVVTIEPGVYIPGWGGVRVEDDVLITNDGCQLLTDITRDLIEIEA